MCVMCVNYQQTRCFFGFRFAILALAPQHVPPLVWKINLLSGYLFFPLVETKAGAKRKPGGDLKSVLRVTKVPNHFSFC